MGTIDSGLYCCVLRRRVISDTLSSDSRHWANGLVPRLAGVQLSHLILSSQQSPVLPPELQLFKSEPNLPVLLRLSCPLLSPLLTGPITLAFLDCRSVRIILHV